MFNQTLTAVVMILRSYNEHDANTTVGIATHTTSRAHSGSWRSCGATRLKAEVPTDPKRHLSTVNTNTTYHGDGHTTIIIIRNHHEYDPKYGYKILLPVCVQGELYNSITSQHVAV